jgi:hypothetical protein
MTVVLPIVAVGVSVACVAIALVAVWLVRDRQRARARRAAAAAAAAAANIELLEAEGGHPAGAAVLPLAGGAWPGALAHGGASGPVVLGAGEPDLQLDRSLADFGGADPAEGAMAAPMRGWEPTAAAALVTGVDGGDDVEAGPAAPPSELERAVPALPPFPAAAAAGMMAADRGGEHNEDGGDGEQEPGAPGMAMVDAGGVRVGFAPQRLHSADQLDAHEDASAGTDG